MGIFNRTVGKEMNNDAETLCDKIRRSLRGDSAQLITLIQSYVQDPSTLKIRPLSLYLDTMEMILSMNTLMRVENVTDTLRYGEGVYPYIFTYDEMTPDFENLRNMFLDMFDVRGAITKRVFHPTLFQLFRDKQNFIRWASIVPMNSDFRKRNTPIIEYALKSRAFFADEDTYTVNLMYITEKFLKNEADERIFEENMSELRRMAGIYEISEERILSAEQKISNIQRVAASMKDSLALVEERAKTLNEISENTVKSADDYCQSTLLRMKSKIEGLSEDMEREHRSFIEMQHETILADKEELVRSVFNESQAELAELKKTVSKIILSAKTELMNANRESGDIMNKVQNYLQNDERVQKLLSDAKDSKVLNDRIDKLMVLNDSTIDYVSEQADNAANAKAAVQEEKATKNANRPAQKGVAEAPTVVTMQNITTGSAEAAPIPASATVFVEEEVTPEATYLLDESVPYAIRWEEAMKRKNLMVQKGEHFHAMFDDVLCAVIENANPYLIGPSGCGKTFMVHQIQEILGLESIDIGYINEEYDILGFQTANGGYSRPNFYRCYKYGKIAFCDELDNGNSRATVKLNSFLSNNMHASYSFPNGENVKRHPNFRIVAAGNTTGNGADANYNSREKIEESVQQRFTPIFVNYDNAVEKAILAPYPSWFNFVVLFRDATNAWSKYSHTSAPGIITTRDTARIRRYLDNKSFSASKILEYEFIQTKDAEYLAFLANEMKKATVNDKECTKLLSYFCNRVDQIRSGKDINRMY